MTEPYDSFVERVKNKEYNAILGRMSPQMIDHLHAAMGISGEAGEILEPIKKAILYGKDVPREKLLEETGDLLYYVVVLLNSLGYTLEDAITNNYEKLSKRYPEGYTNEAALSRKDEFLKAAKEVMEKHKDVFKKLAESGD